MDPLEVRGAEEAEVATRRRNSMVEELTMKEKICINCGFYDEGRCRKGIFKYPNPTDTCEHCHVSRYSAIMNRFEALPDWARWMITRCAICFLGAFAAVFAVGTLAALIFLVCTIFELNPLAFLFLFLAPLCAFLTWGCGMAIRFLWEA